MCAARFYLRLPAANGARAAVVALNRLYGAPCRRRWDYKHQTLATRHLSPWRVLLWVKFIEAVMQSRPRALWRLLGHPGPEFRHAMRWYTHIGRRVWPYEIRNFLFRDHYVQHGPTLREFWGAPQNAAAEAGEECEESRLEEPSLA